MSRVTQKGPTTHMRMLKGLILSAHQRILNRVFDARKYTYWYIYSRFVQTVQNLKRLLECTGWCELLLFAYVISPHYAHGAHITTESAYNAHVKINNERDYANFISRAVAGLSVMHYQIIS